MYKKNLTEFGINKKSVDRFNAEYEANGVKLPLMGQFLECSTAHISEQSAKWLENQGEDAQIIAFPKGPYGWFVHINMEDTEEYVRGIRPDLAALIRYAAKNNCELLCLDRDGECLPDFPVYEW